MYPSVHEKVNPQDDVLEVPDSDLVDLDMNETSTDWFVLIN